MISKEKVQFFDQVVSHTRGYFIWEYRAGTREMIYRYVCSKLGEVSPIMISAALKVLRESNAIIYEKKVWWFLTDR